jgi:hypothetical protein
VRDREPSWRKTLAAALPALPFLAILVLLALAHAPVFTTVALLGIAALRTPRASFDPRLATVGPGSSGVAQNTYKYEPYGATAGTTGSVPNPWQFASGYHDTTGWYKFGMRYYSGRLAGGRSSIL